MTIDELRNINFASIETLGNVVFKTVSSDEVLKSKIKRFCRSRFGNDSDDELKQIITLTVLLYVCEQYLAKRTISNPDLPAATPFDFVTVGVATVNLLYCLLENF